MSIEGFVKHGYHYGLVLTRDGGVFGSIQLFDIGEDNLIGVEYTGGSRQAQPMIWHEYKGLRSALQEHRASRSRPRLRLKSSSKPHLKKSRPRLRVKE